MVWAAKIPALDRLNTAMRISIMVVVLGLQPRSPDCSILAQSKIKP
jgi:hypothetical protein